MSRSVFRCISGCAGDHPLDEVIYKCPKCGDLLEVVHDLEVLKTRSAASWIKLFDERYLRTTWPYGSGVWGKKEWVAAPRRRRERRVDAGGGDEPAVGGALRQEHRAAGAVGEAVRDLAHRIVQGPRDDGAGVDGQADDLGRQADPALACASTGDTSAALAAYAAAAGIRALVILPRGKISTAQLVQPLANGADVLAVDGDFDACMEVVKRLAEEEGVYLANSMNSLRVEGQKTVSIEMVQQFDWGVPDWVVIPGGNLGNVSALGAGFLMMRDLGVDPEAAAHLCRAGGGGEPALPRVQGGWDKFEPLTAKPTLASAIQIGNPVSVKKAIRTLKAFNGVVEQASEAELADAAAAADRTGLFNCPHTGVALAALEKLVARGEIRATDRVVVVSTANGLKFTDFKVRYHDGELPEVPNPRHANHPVLLPNDYATIRDAVRRAIDA